MSYAASSPQWKIDASSSSPIVGSVNENCIRIHSIAFRCSDNLAHVDVCVPQHSAIHCAVVAYATRWRLIRAMNGLKRKVEKEGAARVVLLDRLNRQPYKSVEYDVAHDEFSGGTGAGVGTSGWYATPEADPTADTLLQVPINELQFPGGVHVQ